MSFSKMFQYKLNPAAAAKPARKVYLFVDVSGSVKGNAPYWNVMRRVYQQYSSEIDTVYLWGNKLLTVTKREFENFYLSKSFGDMPDTRPEDIARYLVSTKSGTNDNDLVVITTDGGIAQGSVEQTDIILSDIRLKNVQCYIGVAGNANLSVTSPFTRNGTCTVEINDNRGQKTYTFSAQDREMLENLEQLTLEQFENNFSKIEETLISRQMGRGADQPMREILIRTKAKLAKELALKNKDDDANLAWQASLKAGDFETSFKFAQKLTQDYFASDVGMDLSKKFDYLINICSVGLKGQFDMERIKSQRVVMAPVANVVADAVAPEAQEIPKGLAECPISLDAATAQIMIKEGVPILEGLEKNVVDDIISQPVRLLNYPELVQKIISRISNWVGIDSGVKAGDQNPMTREPIAAVIPLGKCYQNVKCANWGMASLFFGNKLVGNPEMYFAVIWYLVTTNKLPWLSDITEQISDTMIYRLETTKTRASLCGLPQMVGTLVPTCCAVWYSVVSGLLNQPTDRDTLRFQIFNIEPLLELIKLLKYPLNADIMLQINRTRVLLTMLSMTKRNEKAFRSKIMALYQNAYQPNFANIGEDVNRLEVVIPYVPLEGAASQEQIAHVLSTFPEYFKTLPVSELVLLASKVSPAYAAANVSLPPYRETQVNPYTYWEYKNVGDRQLIPINPATFRPMFNIVDEGVKKPWKEVYLPKNRLSERSPIFSGVAKYLNFYQKYLRFPNQDEYIIFCYNRYCIGNGIKVLPSFTEEWYQNINDSYNPIRDIIVARALTPANVNFILNDCCPVVRRLELE
jgi:hypothetical protein